MQLLVRTSRRTPLGALCLAASFASFASFGGRAVWAQEPPAEDAAPIDDDGGAPDAEGEAPAGDAAEPAPEAAPAKIEVVSVSRRGMGGKLQIQVYPRDGDRERAQKAIEDAFAEMKRIEDLMSEWLPDSEISKINRAAGGRVEVSRETFEVLQRGREIALLSKGAFALSWAALSSLWDFQPGEGRLHKIPDEARARERAALIDDSKIELQPDTRGVRLTERGMALGVGAIAKSYAIDRALAVLKGAGFDDALVFAGGDIGVRGQKGDRPWLVGIQDPGAEGYFASLPVRDEAIATSGDYEHYFAFNGVRYHSILDPRTGFPARASRSVTVLGPDAAVADALSNAVFVLGPDDGIQLIEKQKGYEAVIVAADNSVVISTGIRDRLRVVHAPTDAEAKAAESAKTEAAAAQEPGHGGAAGSGGESGGASGAASGTSGAPESPADAGAAKPAAGGEAESGPKPGAPGG